MKISNCGVQNMQGLSRCGALVRGQDRDRFLISLFAPLARREALWALLAFNHEIARTREVVSETTLGLIRLQWWRDELEKVYAGRTPAAHEILGPLAAAIEAHGLPLAEFETLLYAREFDLEDVQPETLAGLEKYAEFTNAPLLRLALRIAGEGTDDKAEEGDLVAVAVAYGLTGLLRAVPHHARQARCLLPADLMAAHGIGLESLYTLKPQGDLSAVVQAIAERAGQLLNGRRQNGPVLKATARLAGQYLGHIRRCRYDILAPKMAIPPAFSALRLYTAVNFS